MGPLPTPLCPPWWLRNGHLQTLWPALTRRPPHPAWRRERLELSDGDFLDLDWADGPPDAPLTLLVHGLEGSSRSHYIAALAHGLNALGQAAVALNLRGCSGEPNRLARAYHSGDSAELRGVIHLLHARFPHRPLQAAGFSLGGNMLVKYLGEEGAETPLRAAAAVSVPYRLDLAASHLDQGLPRIYQRWLLGHLHASYQRKFARRDDAPFPIERLAELDSFWRFDDAITAPLHGFEGAADYYRRASSRPWLGGIAVPTLLLHAADDPFFDADVPPTRAELSTSTQFVLTDHGGHVGFVDRRHGYWAEAQLLRFLTHAG